ncbi:MAG: UDP-N-acetylmuramoyl-tripeptide--D-alanyl-D-alanine ligase [Bacteroidota bacterium]
MDINYIYNRFLECDSISIDSRDIINNSLFFSLKGENFNGNKYAEEALSKGCKYAVVDEEEYAVDERYILVDDTLLALQKLGKMHRLQMEATVVGITGTNGKTTTKELVNRVLSEKYVVLATPKNYNNHIGVPLTLLQLNKKHEFAIIEMGANHLHEIKTLCQIAAPDYGVITNIGKAHLEGFGSYEKVIQAKSELYDYICGNNGTIFFNKDNQLLEKLVQQKGCSSFSYGISVSADCRGEIISSVPFLEIRKDNELIKSNMTGKYNFENILAGICIGYFFQVPSKDIFKAIQNYVPENNRSQILKTDKNEIFLDAYNANPTSMHLALENFFEIKRDKKVIILGDMFELGKYSEQEHMDVIKIIHEFGFENVYLVGKEFLNTKAKKYLTFQHTQDLIDYIKEHPITDSSILIKGSRGMALEKLTEYL